MTCQLTDLHNNIHNQELLHITPSVDAFDCVKACSIVLTCAIDQSLPQVDSSWAAGARLARACGADCIAAVGMAASLRLRRRLYRWWWCGAKGRLPVYRDFGAPGLHVREALSITADDTYTHSAVIRVCILYKFVYHMDSRRIRHRGSSNSAHEFQVVSSTCFGMTN